MAKKLSKTQKRKKNLKKKNKNTININKKETNSTKINKTKDTIVKEVPVTKEQKTSKVNKKKDTIVKDVPQTTYKNTKKKSNYYSNNYKRKNNLNNKKTKTLPKLKEDLPTLEPVIEKKEELVKEPIIEKVIPLEEQVEEEPIIKETKIEKQDIKEDKRALVENNKVLYNIFVSPYNQNKKETEESKKEIDLPRIKSNKWYINTFYFIKDNLYLLFNTILGLTFFTLIIGLFETKAFDKGTILFIGGILLFLIIIAMSYNKHMSGKVFTIILCLGMGLYINKLQYNYDFIHSLDSINYEDKTYYVVTFDTLNNRNIYGLNNKKVGILPENKNNIVRKLDIKMDNINYIDFKDLDELTNSLFHQEIRAVIVTPNQYKYLLSIKYKYNREIKVLYEFNAVGLK